MYLHKRMVSAQERLPPGASVEVIAGEQKQGGIACRNESAMLPTAHATDLRVVTGARKNALQEAIENRFLE